MQNDSFKMRQHYAPYNRSEESHRRTEGAYMVAERLIGYVVEVDEFFGYVKFSAHSGRKGK